MSQTFCWETGFNNVGAFPESHAECWTSRHLTFCLKFWKVLVSWSIGVVWVVVSHIYFHPYLGKWSNLTSIFFQMGWNHQPDWSCEFKWSIENYRFQQTFNKALVHRIHDCLVNICLLTYHFQQKPKGREIGSQYPCQPWKSINLCIVCWGLRPLW